MKILRLKLENFIGIKHGLNRDSIELDFTKGNNKITMFLGGNGSGKSTILSQLHPYKNSFDDRKNLILDGCNGLKEIDIEHNGHIYKIVHHYSANGTAQSFIKEDDVELNENGGVRTCEDKIKEKLGLTQDYFKIGKIGSNTKNFVDFTAAERKNYIGTFLNIDDILSSFKIVKDKINSYKKEISSIAGDLSKFESKEVVESKIKKYTEDLETAEKELMKLLPIQGSLTTQIERDKNEIGDLSLVDLENRQKEKQNDIETNTSIKTKLESELDNLEDAKTEKQKLQEEISKLQGDIRVNNEKKSNLDLVITDIKQKIFSTQTRLAGLGKKEDIENLKNEVEAGKKSLSELKEALLKNPEGRFVQSLIVKKSFSRQLQKFITFTNFIEKYFTDLQKKTSNNVDSNIKIFLADNCDESLTRQVKQSQDTIKGKHQLLSVKENEKTIEESFRCQLSNLEKRPEKCTIDDCPFIKKALLHKDVEYKIADLEKVIEVIKCDLEELDSKAETINETLQLYNQFKQAYEELSPRENEIFIEFIKEKSLIEWVSSELSEFQNARQEYVDRLESAESTFMKYAEVVRNVTNKEEQLNVLSNNGDEIRQEYQKDLDEYNLKLEDNNRHYTELNAESNELSDELKLKQTLLTKYDEYISADSTLKSATVMLSDVKGKISALKELLANQQKAQTQLLETNTKIDKYKNLKALSQQELTKLNTELTQINTLNEKLEKLKENYTPTETVYNALSPTAGIPVVFMKMYLAETEKITNDLLQTAFGDDFRIEFQLEEKEFKIKVIAKENIKEDIRLASQGEIALTTISISLALIEQSIGEYNILCLDEIDGPLDKENRGNFINILNGQIEKLGIEQVFVISHNNAFDICPMNLVLLKNNSADLDNDAFMNNKTIIFNYERD